MNGSLGAVLVCLAEGASLDNPAVLHDDVHVVGVEHVDVGGDVTVRSGRQHLLQRAYAGRLRRQDPARNRARRRLRRRADSA